FVPARGLFSLCGMTQPVTPAARALRYLGLFSCLIVAGSCARAAAAQKQPDPVLTDGDKYHLLFENELVRVLRYRDEPSAQTHLHHHPCFVLYALGPFKRELGFADGSQRIRDFKGGEAVWMPAQTHRGHNIGATPTD